MKYGYLDESGDVGQSENASRHLLVAMVVVDQPKILQAVIARTRKWLKIGRASCRERVYVLV